MAALAPPGPVAVAVRATAEADSPADSVARVPLAGAASGLPPSSVRSRSIGISLRGCAVRAAAQPHRVSMMIRTRTPRDNGVRAPIVQVRSTDREEMTTWRAPGDTSRRRSFASVLCSAIRGRMGREPCAIGNEKMPGRPQPSSFLSLANFLPCASKFSRPVAEWTRPELPAPPLSAGVLLTWPPPAWSYPH